jgi:hypothetical protein
MGFEKGNNAAAGSSKKAIAEMIRKRLEKDGDSLDDAQFTTLVNRFNSLTAKRRPRRHRKVIGSAADRLTGKEAEIHRAVVQIEAERAEAARKERNGNTA